jgi:mannose-6-phosphate isomerase
MRSPVSDSAEHRPWGGFEVLVDEPDYKIKHITVHSGRRLSLQYHRRRDEHWFFVTGVGLVTRGEETIAAAPGLALDIPAGATHRVENTGEEPLVFVEIQTGAYFGEDDIVRLADDFGRVMGKKETST